jgi:threonine dehydratase
VSQALTIVTLADVRAAHDRIRAHVHRTPVLTSRALNELVGAELWFKCENFQRAGSFKLRGALNAVLSLDAAAATRGVATHSSGNFGAALALAASIRGIPAYIVVPQNAPRIKRAAIDGYGGIVTECASNVPAREAALDEVVRRTGANPIHPYDDARIVAGQATATLELLDQAPLVEQIWVPDSSAARRWRSAALRRTCASSRQSLRTRTMRSVRSRAAAFSRCRIPRRSPTVYARRSARSTSRFCRPTA